jgi:extracellular elastinolytic metalloproteinase
MRHLFFLLAAMVITASAFAQPNDADISAAKALIRSQATAIGLSEKEQAETRISSSYKTIDGIQMVYAQQSFKGIPVYNQLQVLAFRDGKLVSNMGARRADLESVLTTARTQPLVTAIDAVRNALRIFKAEPKELLIPVDISSDAQVFRFGTVGVNTEPVKAELLWFPMENKKNDIRLVWQVFITPYTSDQYWLIRIDAQTGEEISRQSLTITCALDKEPHDAIKHTTDHTPSSISARRITNRPDFNYVQLQKENKRDWRFSPRLIGNATYRVIKYPAESPNHIGGTPSLHTNPWEMTPGNATSLKWNSDPVDYNITRGNNVYAQEDRDGLNSTIGLPVTSTTSLPDLTFDFTYDFAKDPTDPTSDNQKAAIVNLFYWNNIIHDLSYVYGFDEPSGNFQNDNQGRGGAGIDYVIADAQDRGNPQPQNQLFNNANFSTPADGSRPRMQMFIWTPANPDRDSDMDNGIIVHEYTHGISNRMTGGPATTSCLTNSEQAGEGWSDYFGLMATTDWSTATLTSGANPRGVGTYVVNQPITGTGIRRHPYSTSMTTYPLTYANLPGSPIPHGVGEIWCNMLWEMTWAIIQKDQAISTNLFTPGPTSSMVGNAAAMKLVMEGMRLQVCNPGFVDSRNAILKADTLLFNARYSCVIWQAFAKRGLGRNASQGSNASITDGVADFTVDASTFTVNESLATVPEGQSVTYTNKVTAGNCGALSNYTLTDTLPTNVTYVSGGSYNASNRVVSFSGINLAAGQTQSYPFTVSINTGTYFAPITVLNEPVFNTTIPATWTVNGAWTVSNTQSSSSPNAFFMPNPTTISDDRLALTTGLVLNPATVSNYTTLSFKHAFNTEDGWDGGLVEISTNGGITWTDLGSRMYEGKYNGSMGTGSNNPVGGRAAFTGLSNGFWTTKVNLSSYAGQTIQIRFRFGSDDNTAPSGGGWWVDDINIYSEPAVTIRSNLINASGVRTSFSDTITRIVVGCTPVTITTQPANAGSCLGGNTSFTVVTQGLSNVYQWQLNSGSGFVNLSNDATYGGVTTATLTVGNVSAGMVGYQYRCIISNSCTAPINSSAATLSIGTASTISSQPQSVTGCDGGTASFVLGASGTGNTYQWQLNTPSGWVNITNGGFYNGATTATLTLSNITMPLSGYQFRCLLSSVGCPSVVSTSTVATLTVQALPTLTSQPAPQTICVGSGTSFTVSASGSGLTYQWQINTPTGWVSLSNGGAYAGVTTSTLILSNATLLMHNGQYRCVVTGVCPPALLSDAATLTVHAPAAVSASPTNQEVCSGSAVTFTVSGTSVPTISYQWQTSTNGGVSWTDISGANGATFTISNVLLSATGNRYRCLLSNATCPAQAASNAALLTVRQQPSVSLTASPLTGLLPGQQTVLTATPSAPTGGTYSYTWSLNGSALTVSGNLLTVNVTQAGTYQTAVRESWPSGLVCSANSAVVNIVALASERLFIYPSPNDGRFTVSYYNSGGASGQRWIRVYNGLGSLVYDRTLPIAGTYTLIPIDLQRMARGIYYVVVGDGSGKRLTEGKVHVR